MSSKNPLTFQTIDSQREAVLKSAITAYYAHMTDRTLIFDTSRAWCTLVPLLASLFPDSRVICCIRSPAWILDSVEQIIQANVYQPSKMFDSEPLIAQGSRVDAMVRPGGFLGGPMSALQQAWFSNFADRLIAVRYESLVEKPAEVIGKLYELLGEKPFDHDFDHVRYEAPEFDGALGTPGLHTVRPKVELRSRKTLLPPQLFSRFEHGFWDLPGQNPAGVEILFDGDRKVPLSQQGEKVFDRRPQPVEA
jgi:sulfotransferase